MVARRTKKKPVRRNVEWRSFGSGPGRVVYPIRKSHGYDSSIGDRKAKAKSKTRQAARASERRKQFRVVK